MKTKIIISSLMVILFGLLGGGSLTNSGKLSEEFWFFIGLVIVVVVSMVIIGDIQEDKRQTEALEKKKRIKKKEAEQEAHFEEWYANYIAANGTPDKTIIVRPNDEMEIILVHELKKQVYMEGKMYSFKDIISVTFTDSPTTIKGKTTATTKSSTDSAVGRAIVGDLIAGPAGAIIGGTTGEKTTEFHHENDKTIHDYTVVINLNSIATPILRINTGSDGKTTNEIVGLMNVIISRR